MKIGAKITFCFFLITLLLTTLAISVVYVVERRDLGNAIFAHLITTSEARTDHVNGFLEMQEAMVKQLAESIVLEDLLSTSRQSPDYAERFEIVTRRLERTQKANENLFYECFVLNAEGKVVASSNKVRVGLDRASDDYFLGAKERVHIKDAYYSDIAKQHSLTFSAPIINNKTKEFLGVVVNKVSLGMLNVITTDRTGLGKTGEMYLINRYGYMITHSRFAKNNFLKLKVDTLKTKRFFEDVEKFGYAHEHGHKPFIYKDYRGVKVLGVHACVPRMQWCLLAEMDESEAFAPLYRLSFVLFTLIVLAPILTWLVGRFAARLIAEPIYQLRKGIEIIGQGNLDYKVGTEAKDEIGDLSRAFDRMTRDLKKSTTSIGSLQREVVERKKAEEKAKEALKIKSEFASIVSHELRTPLTAIKEGIAIVSDGSAGSVNDEQKDFLDTAKRNVDRLARLINDVLDFQKLEYGRVKFDIQENDINEVARDVQKEMVYLAKEKELDFILKLDEKLPRIRFDRDKIVQVLMNLVNNSVKFTNKGSITITTAREGNTIRVSVKDTGVGIEKEDIPRLFHKFEQLAEAKNRKTGGTGLGLAISRGILAGHKGKIWTESEPGRGATFHFVLPIEERRN